MASFTERPVSWVCCLLLYSRCGSCVRTLFPLVTAYETHKHKLHARVMWRCSLAAAKIVGVLDKCITSPLGNCVCQSPVGPWAEALLASRTMYSRNVPWETDTNIRVPDVCPSGRYWHSNSLVKGKCNGSIHWSLSPVTVPSKFLDVCVILAASSSSWNSNISRWVSFTLGLLWWLTWVKNLPAMQETQVRSLG